MKDKSTIFDSEGHVYDAQVFSDGVLFTARRPEVSLIIVDEERTDELAEVSRLIDEMHDEFFDRVDKIVSLILGS